MPTLFVPTGLTPAGMALLLDAFDVAQDSGLPRWEVAVKWPTLRKAGCTDTGLQWLIAKSFAEHAFERTLPFDRKRSFRRLTTAWFHRRSCFILSDAGATFVREVCRGNTASPHILLNATSPPPSDPVATVEADVRIKPHWDAAHRQLMVGGKAVKRFKRPARNQELILAAFQEEDWPARVDDPIPGIRGKSAGRRLHDAIKALNRHQTEPGVHFFGDGSGRGVCWQHGVPGAPRGASAHRESDDG
jgi:hypothetical protein